MGCGKSHIGRMLASRLGMKLIDLDRYIVNAEKMTIPEIFEQFGEPHFRALEAKYIRELSEGFIVATGGGALLNCETAKFARESGISVYINTSFETCFDRIKGDKNRPLVVKNTPEQLRELYNARAPIYRQNSTFMVNGNTSDHIITGEIAKLAQFSGQAPV
ncbi:MAG: shikimate kinase [Oscillospiraceae bacterium]|nr:shikimate kinase [Oscillospiraceae bacterium]